MHTQRHDEKRKNRKTRRRRRYLFMTVTTLVAMALSSVPFYMELHYIQIDTSSSSILTPDIDSRIAAPCSCNFGSCLQWDTENLGAQFPCANLYPLRWYETWDDKTKAWYFRHKRTMHFEVINLFRDDSKTNNTSCNYPGLITYFHIFKNGGTTVRNAFWKEQTRLPYKKAKILFTGIQSRIGTDEFHNRLNQTVSRLYKGQQSKSNGVFAFTFLRDPVSRFLSGMGQVLNKYKFGILTESFALAPCFSDDLSTSEMLDCSLAELIPMIDKGPNEPEFYFFDFHLLPQAFLLRDFTGEQDISLMVMDMKHIQNVLNTLIPHPPEGDNSSAERRFWARPSRSVNYTGGHDLKDPQLLTIEQKRLICRLYHMDVKLLAATKVLSDSFCFKQTE
jgi:hypothetical protein